MPFLSGKCTSTARLDGKTAVITGCNTGIGKETVLDLCKGSMIEDIRKATAGVEGVGVIVVVRLDLSSFASVRECAEKLLKTESQINLLINNGAGGINFDDINGDKSYSASSAYAQSKLANVLFAKEFATRLQNAEVKGITTYSLHPGVVDTNLYRNLDSALFSGMEWINKHLLSHAYKTPKQGAQTTIYCAVDEHAADETGCYYSDCVKKKPSCKARDAKMASRLWEESIKMVGIEDPLASKT